MINEKLQEELRNLRSDMARMCKNEYIARRRFFQMIREIASRHKDKQGNILWDAVEAELQKSDGLITPPTGKISHPRFAIMTAYPPGEGPKPR
jgi:hypothetical protein